MKFKVNIDRGLFLPVKKLIEGKEVVTMELCKSQSIVELSDLTDEIEKYIEEGSLVEVAEHFLEED
jgi:queuine/archaeosine tRNA-ribosyltransferase